MGAFNVDSVDMLFGVIDGAEAAGAPIIIQVTTDTLNEWGWSRFSAAIRQQAEGARVDIGLHLDHCKSVDKIRRAIDVGFTSVMYDGSILSLDENILNTQAVVSFAKSGRVMVEAELGHVARGGEPSEWEAVTQPADAEKFFRYTEVDVLAVAIGTQHAQHVDEGHIRYDALDAIRKTVPCPLVLHGSSGVPDPVLLRLVAKGISKVNIGTELRTIWWRTVQNMNGKKPREVLSGASRAIGSYVENKIRLLSR